MLYDNVTSSGSDISEVLKETRLSNYDGIIETRDL